MGVKHTLPGLKVPVVDFWSFMVYDVHTLSILETDQKYGEINSKLEGINLDENRSVQIFFPRSHFRVKKLIGYRLFRIMDFIAYCDYTDLNRHDLIRLGSQVTLTL